ncbi:helix-turn-helix transcriptional regulator [Microbacterium sp. 2MCAF23]|uniref:helix-turn-helix transcriptional regulator n=1 Tax=Microbacterium sp. 2MCAF23 TaxID=3232985 RepID=UPI003F995F76
MTTQQLSEYLQIPVRTLEDWRAPRSRRGPKAIHLGNRVRYRLSTVNEWLESLEAETDAA